MTQLKRIWYFPVLLLLFFASVQAQAASNSEQKTTKEKKYTYKILRLSPVSFGYDVYEDDKLLIHQPSIPGLAGNHTFQTIGDAEKIAKLVIKKLKSGQIPPAISKSDLDAQKIKY